MRTRVSRRKTKNMPIRFSFRSLLLPLAVLTLSVASFAQIEISVNLAPPELPVYEQPVCPGDGYIWTPGYWGLGRRRLLLGSRHVGSGSATRLFLDAWILGLGRQ